MIKFLAAGLMILTVQAAQPAAAEPAAAPSADRPALLDRLLASKDYKALGQTIGTAAGEADVRSDLDWLKARMMEGNSAFLTMLYSRLLWAASAPLPEPAKGQLQQTAAMTTLYALGAISIDGARCGDKTAPSHRLDQLMAWNPEIWPFIAALSPADRQQLIDVAVLLEKHTADRGDAVGDVEFLCRAGLEETQYNLAHGTAREVPTPKGGVGKTIELSGDGKYKPSERPQAEWRPQMAEARSKLPAELAKLVGELTE